MVLLKIQKTYFGDINTSQPMFRLRKTEEERELVALLNLSSWCLVMVARLFLVVPWSCLQSMIVVFPDHTHLLICIHYSIVLKLYVGINKMKPAKSIIKIQTKSKHSLKQNHFSAVKCRTLRRALPIFHSIFPHCRQCKIGVKYPVLP